MRSVFSKIPFPCNKVRNITTLTQTTFGIVLKLYKNSFSDKMHWSLDFYKADLERLEVGKKQNKTENKPSPQKYLITAQERIKQVIEP